MTRVEAERLDRFRALYDELHTDIWRYCARRVRPVEDAEDVLADVFAVVWRRLSDVPEPPDSRAWVYVVARNHVQDRTRRLVRRDRLEQRAAAEPAGPAPDDDARQEQDDVRHVRAALDRLSEKDAEILRLAVWDELPHREIARLIGCRQSTVAVRLHRARRRLARLLADDPSGPGASRGRAGSSRNGPLTSPTAPSHLRPMAVVAHLRPGGPA